MKTEDLKNQVLEQELNDEELDNVAGGKALSLHSQD